jgi:hypothetical protein
MNRRIVLGFFAYLLSGLALAAYPCPNGPGPGERQVGSTGGSHGVGVVPMCERSDSSGPVEASPQWASRWGAIYIDYERSAFGVSENMPSKGKAKKAAEQDCIARGGKKCKIKMESRNQCSALASNQAYTSFARNSTKEEAESVVLAKCLRNSGQECTLLYSGCSYPVRIR